MTNVSSLEVFGRIYDEGEAGWAGRIAGGQFNRIIETLFENLFEILVLENLIENIF